MNRIEKIYVALGYNRHSFAQRLGVADSTVKGWEESTGNMTMNTCKVLHQMYGVSFEYLMGQGSLTGNSKIDKILNMLSEIEQLRKELTK